MVSAVMKSLSVALGETLSFVLLADGIAVDGSLRLIIHNNRKYLGAVHDFLSQALGDRLDFAERGLTGT